MAEREGDENEVPGLPGTGPAPEHGNDAGELSEDRVEVIERAEGIQRLVLESTSDYWRIHFAIDEEDVGRLLKPADDDQVAALIEEIEEEATGVDPCDTDKAWDAIHRSLTDGYLGYGNGTFPLNAVTHSQGRVRPHRRRGLRTGIRQRRLRLHLVALQRHGHVLPAGGGNRTARHIHGLPTGMFLICAGNCRHRNLPLALTWRFSWIRESKFSICLCSSRVHRHRSLLPLHTTVEDHAGSQPEIRQNSRSEVPSDELHPFNRPISPSRTPATTSGNRPTTSLTCECDPHHNDGLLSFA